METQTQTITEPQEQNKEEMKKVYLFVFGNSFGTRAEAIDCVDNIPEVETWRYDMPNSFFLISEYSAQDISEAIYNYSGRKMFIVTEITDNKQGFLPQETWVLINEKRHVQKQKKRIRKIF